MARMQINYLDRKDRIIAFYVLCGEYEPHCAAAWTHWLKDASLMADINNYPGAPVGWAKFEIVPSSAFKKAYVICNKCHGIATAGYRVDDCFALDCPACGRHLQDSANTESPDEAVPGPEAETQSDEMGG